MPIDFDWQEGSHRFHPESVPVQPAPPPAPPPRESHAPRSRPRLSNLTLLALGIVLGIIAGVSILTYEGQRNARADVAPVLVLQQQALEQGDRDLYRSLIDDRDPAWQAAMVNAQPQTVLLSDQTPPIVHRVTLQGDLAEADVVFRYDDRAFHRLESLRLTGNQWRLAPVQVGDWGPVATTTGEYVTLHYRQRDAFLAELLPQMDIIARTFCRRYAAPSPCRVELSIEPDPDLLPFLPGQGAATPLALTRIEALRSPGNAAVMLNPQTDGAGDNATVRQLAQFLGVRSIRRLKVTTQVAPAVPQTAGEASASAALAVRFISPHLVGWSGKTPHPLWWLALTETLGETILRQTLGPVTGSDQAVYTLWAAARGDVALWAERLSGVPFHNGVLPHDGQVATETDPAVIGASLAAGDTTQRAAARSFALYLHATVGEKGLLAMLEKAHNTLVIRDATAIFGQTPEDLAAGWRQWRDQRAQTTVEDSSPTAGA